MGIALNLANFHVTQVGNIQKYAHKTNKKKRVILILFCYLASTKSHF